MEEVMKKTIITVVGKDTVGIIAKVCTYLAENQINILDISQTIVSGYFNMMMISDMANANVDYSGFTESQYWDTSSGVPVFQGCNYYSK